MNQATQSWIGRCAATLCLLMLTSAWSATSSGAEEQGKKNAKPSYQTLVLRGKVVFAAEALQRRYGIKTVPDSRTGQVVLETENGIVPIVDDVRGRAFRSDKRLRDCETEMLVRKYDGSPMVQVIRLFQLQGEQRFEIDYWCEICAIAMYELKACDCCQGDIELRRRRTKGKLVSPRPSEK